MKLNHTQSRQMQEAPEDRKESPWWSSSETKLSRYQISETKQPTVWRRLHHIQHRRSRANSFAQRNMSSLLRCWTERRQPGRRNTNQPCNWEMNEISIIPSRKHKTFVNIPRQHTLQPAFQCCAIRSQIFLGRMWSACSAAEQQYWQCARKGLPSRVAFLSPMLPGGWKV